MRDFINPTKQEQQYIDETVYWREKFLEAMREGWYSEAGEYQLKLRYLEQKLSNNKEV